MPKPAAPAAHDDLTDMKTFHEELQKITFRRPTVCGHYINAEWVLANIADINTDEFRSIVSQYGGASALAAHTGFGRVQIERLAQMIGAPVFKRPKPAPPPPPAQEELQLIPVAATQEQMLEWKLERESKELQRVRDLAERRFNRTVLLGMELNKANRALQRANKAKKRHHMERNRLRAIARICRTSEAPDDKIVMVQFIRTMTLDYVPGKPLKPLNSEEGAE